MPTINLNIAANIALGSATATINYTYIGGVYNFTSYTGPLQVGSSFPLINVGDSVNIQVTALLFLGTLNVVLNLSPNTLTKPYSSNGIQLYYNSSPSCYHQHTYFETSNGLKQAYQIRKGDLVKGRNRYIEIVNNVLVRKQNDFIAFPPDSISIGIPDRYLLISKWHVVEYKGERKEAQEWANNDIQHLSMVDDVDVYHFITENGDDVYTHGVYTTTWTPEEYQKEILGSKKMLTKLL